MAVGHLVDRIILPLLLRNASRTYNVGRHELWLRVRIRSGRTLAGEVL